jgi:hypothetical protein
LHVAARQRLRLRRHDAKDRTVSPGAYVKIRVRTESKGNSHIGGNAATADCVSTSAAAAQNFLIDLVKQSIAHIGAGKIMNSENTEFLGRIYCVNVIRSRIEGKLTGQKSYAAYYRPQAGIGIQCMGAGSIHIRIKPA